MRLDQLLFFATKLLFGRTDSAAKGGAGKSLRGAVAGIALSLVPLVIVFELADGMIEGIMTRNVELSSYHAQARLPGDARAGELRAAAGRVRASGEAASAYPEIQGLGVALGPGGRGGASIRAVDPAMLAEDPSFAELLRVDAGKLALPDRNSALLGAALAEKIGAGPGDRVSLLTLRTGISGKQSPRLSSFRVSGVVSSGYKELDEFWFFIGLDAGEGVLSGPSSRSFVGIKLSGGMGGADGEPPSFPALRNALGSEWELTHWSDVLDALRRSLLTNKTLLILISALIIVVAAVNVSSAVIMLVIERRQDIAVLKSMGASQAGISAAFTAAGAVIGTIASAIGMAAGIFMAVNINENIRLLNSAVNFILALDARVRGIRAGSFSLLDPEYYLSVIPVKIDFAELLAAGCATILISSFAAWLSARWKTKSIPPLEVLRRS